MIEGYSEEEFGKTVHAHVRPAERVSSVELLKGRHKELGDIRRALFAKGRHMFIYGDRGIGKSSLAQTMDETKVPKQMINPRLHAVGNSRRFQPSIPSGISLKDE